MKRKTIYWFGFVWGAIGLKIMGMVGVQLDGLVADVASVMVAALWCLLGSLLVGVSDG